MQSELCKVQSELCSFANPHLQTNTEEKISGNMTYELSVINRLIMHYSTLPRLLRAISWWLRLICAFYNRIKRSKIDPALLIKYGPVTVVEYNNQSLLVTIRCAQKQAFGDLIDMLKKGDCHDIEAGRFGNWIKGMLKPLRAYCPFVGHVTVRDADGKLFQREVAKISLLEGDID